MEYVIEDTKTNAGTRVLPMTNDVYECFKSILEKQTEAEGGADDWRQDGISVFG